MVHPGTFSTLKECGNLRKGNVPQLLPGCWLGHGHFKGMVKDKQAFGKALGGLQLDAECKSDKTKSEVQSVVGGMTDVLIGYIACRIRRRAPRASVAIRPKALIR